jgi:hypothetical protein
MALRFGANVAGLVAVITGVLTPPLASAEVWLTRTAPLKISVSVARSIIALDSRNSRAEINDGSCIRLNQVQNEEAGPHPANSVTPAECRELQEAAKLHLSVLCSRNDKLNVGGRHTFYCRSSPSGDEIFEEASLNGVKSSSLYKTDGHIVVIDAIPVHDRYALSAIVVSRTGTVERVSFLWKADM